MQNVLVLLIINDKAIILANELLAGLRAVEPEVSDRVLRRIVMDRQVVLAVLLRCFLATRVGQQCDHARGMRATMHEVPLIDGNLEV